MKSVKLSLKITCIESMAWVLSAVLRVGVIRRLQGILCGGACGWAGAKGPGGVGTYRNWQ